MHLDNFSTLLGTPESKAESYRLRAICSFWRRIFALLIDCVFLFVIGLILGLFFFNFFARLGGWGRLVGFGIAFLYFGVLNSSLGKGQTIGKRLTKIKVINRDERCISLFRSFTRYVVLAVPFFLSDSLLPESILVSPIGILVGLIVLGLGGAIIYLYLFNRRTRQSLHDLVVGTYVVRSSTSEELEYTPIWKGHIAVIGLWAIVLILFFTVISPKLLRREPFPLILSVQRSILESGKVHTATVFVGTTWGGFSKAKDLRVNAIWKQRPESYEQSALEIASIILKEYPEVMNMNVLGVVITYGYDIGIADSWQSFHAQHSPEEWKKKLSDHSVNFEKGRSL